MYDMQKYTPGLVKLLIETIQSYQIHIVTFLVVLGILAALALSLYYILDLIVLRFVRRWARNKRYVFLRVIAHNGTLNVLPHLVSSAMFLSWTKFIYKSNALESMIEQFVHYAALLYMFICLALLITRLIWSFNSYYENRFDFAHEYPIYSYIRVIILFVWIVWVILVIAYFAGMSPISILTGVGAISAVVILIFKDTLLGVVASIQITASNIVNIGDRICIDKYGVDGAVLDISINTVKVKNSDNTIATIPTYTLTSEVVKNWRGMVNSGARRIKRAIHIDINSIAKCSQQLLDELSKFNAVKDYLSRHKGEEIINIALYREYITNYLRSNPQINHDYTTLVRHLEPGLNGLPLEIITFTRDVSFVGYENIQSDIFEHCFSVLTQFKLQVLQYPS
ncbi:MAG: miniconductance mechanosensitive channel [Pseudomonadota bacterium]|nr:miniconductance mechanosensitive channel [Pseudomonadota bacterium]